PPSPDTFRMPPPAPVTPMRMPSRLQLIPEKLVMLGNEATVVTVPPTAGTRLRARPALEKLVNAMAVLSGENAGLSAMVSTSVRARDSASASERTRRRPLALYAILVPSGEIATSCWTADVKGPSGINENRATVTGGTVGCMRHITKPTIKAVDTTAMAIART